MIDYRIEKPKLLDRFPWMRRTIAGILAGSLFLSIVAVGLEYRQKKVLPQTDPVAVAPPEAGLTNAGAGAGENQGGSAAASAETQKEDPFAAAMLRSDQAIEAGDYEAAGKELETCATLAKTEDQKAMLLAQKGRLSYQKQDIEQALLHYEALDALEQTIFTKADLAFTIGRCYLLLEQAQKAKESCDAGIRALSAQQKGAELYVLRGTASLYLEEYDLAIKDFETAKTLGYSDLQSLQEQIALCKQLSGQYVVTNTGQRILMDETSQLSLAYYALGMYEQAAEVYEKLLKQGSNYYTKQQIYSCLAKCYIFLGKYQEAMAAAKAGLALKDKTETATLKALLATAEMATGAYETAAKTFQESVDAGYEKREELYAQSAASNYYAGVYREAIRYGELALKEAGADTEAVLWLALSYYQMENYGKAAPLIERALKVKQPYCDTNELIRCLTRSYLLLGEYEKVLVAAKPALTPADGYTVTGAAVADIYALRGAAQLSLGAYREAIGDFYAAVALGYADPYEIYRQTTLCHFLLSEYEEAAASGERALDNGEGNGELYYWIGISYFSLARYDEAEQALKKAAELEDAQKNLLFYLGVCRFSQNDYEGAIAYFNQSEEKNESKEKCIYNRALCYLQMGEYKKAETDLKAAAAQTTEPDVASDATELLEKLKSILNG